MIVGINLAANPLVDYRGNPTSEPLCARTTVEVGPEHVGQNAVILLIEAEPDSPVIVGVINPSGSRAKTCAFKADGETIVLTAEREIILECGEARITLTRAGKVLIQGAYIGSRASGVNRIKGGSVQIN